MPEEDKIFGEFLECLVAPLEGVPTYEYMTNINVYLNSYSSAVDCTLGCGSLGFLVLTAQPAVFNTHCGTEFVTPINLGIHPVMPDPAPTAAIFPNSSEHTSTKFVCLTNTTHLIVCARKSSAGWSWRNSTSPFRAVSLASRRSQSLIFLLTSSPSTLSLKKKTCKTSIVRWNKVSPEKLYLKSLSRKFNGIKKQ